MTDEITTSEKNETQAALNAGLALAEPKELQDGKVYHGIVPEDGRAFTIDTEHYASAPRRAKGTYKPATVDAFLDVIARHCTPDDLTVWVHPQSGKITAIFNDQAGTLPAWRDHRAVLQLNHTDEWCHWMARDNMLGSQTEFAHHIEDGLSELSDPPAADMLELAQTFQANQNATFRTAIRLQDGTVQTQYVEEQEAAAGKSGQMSIPSEFKLVLAAFQGEAPVEVLARLRYRVSAGKLAIGYRLVRPRQVIRASLDAIAERITQVYPSAVYSGDPE